MKPLNSCFKNKSTVEILRNNKRKREEEHIEIEGVCRTDRQKIDRQTDRGEAERETAIESDRNNQKGRERETERKKIIRKREP